MASAALFTGGGNSARKPVVIACRGRESDKQEEMDLSCLPLFPDLEDGLEGDFRGGREGEHGKVSDEARGDRVAASTRRSTGCTDGHILGEGINALNVH